MSNAMEVNDQNFEQEVLRSDKPVLVDFWAAWCGPCKMIAPELDKLAAEVSDKLKVTKLNVDDNNATAAKYNVMSIPTLVLFKSGNEAERLVGLQSKDDLINKLSKHF